MPRVKLDVPCPACFAEPGESCKIAYTDDPNTDLSRPTGFRGASRTHAARLHRHDLVAQRARRLLKKGTP